MKTAGILLGALISFAGALIHAQPSLTVKDYDNFYSLVILKAKNSSKAEWLASYESIVSFIARVRQDVETLPAAGQRALAKAVHDTDWKGQELRVRDPKTLSSAPRSRQVTRSSRRFSTPQGYDAYRGAMRRERTDTASHSRWYRIRVALYKLEGKSISAVGDSGQYVHSECQRAELDDLVADAQRDPDPGARMGEILRNQMNGIASALSLPACHRNPLGPRDGRRHRSDLALHGALQRQGRLGARTPVRISYPQLSKAEKAKDRNVWKAVRDVLKADPI